MAELSKLPQEMKEQILSRLPPKSLVRFKCVHKSWYTLISNPNFAAKQVSISKNNKLSSTTTILFKRYVLDLDTDEKKIVLSLYDLCNHYMYDDNDHHLPSIMEDLHVPPSMGLKGRDRFHHGIEAVEIAGHCDGIICLTDYRKNVVLCNPSIQEFNRLPVSCLTLSCADVMPNGSPTAAVGFGYDLKSKNYIVVRILYSGRDDGDMRVVIHPPKAEVFRLVTNSWKEIKADNLDNETTNVWPDSTTYICCKGTLYWCAHEDKKEYDVSSTEDLDEEDIICEDGDLYWERERIISFDIASRRFHVRLFPDGCFFNRKVFGVLNECIAICSKSWSQEGSLDIWVLDEISGVEDSWTKFVTFEPVVNIKYPLTLVGKSELFMLVALDECGVVMFYDFCTNNLKYLPMNGVFQYNTQAVYYVSSIVAIRGE